jgi:hypothetical protein
MIVANKPDQFSNIPGSICVSFSLDYHKLDDVISWLQDVVGSPYCRIHFDLDFPNRVGDVFRYLVFLDNETQATLFKLTFG